MLVKKKAKIIRSGRFNKENDPENYCREQLVLYTSWRNKHKGLIKDCKTYQERYKQVEEIIKSNREQYKHHSDILDKALEDLNNHDSYSAPVAPNTQHMNEEDIAVKTKPTELFECFDPGTNKQRSQYDLFQDMNILPRNSDDEEQTKLLIR